MGDITIHLEEYPSCPECQEATGRRSSNLVPVSIEEGIVWKCTHPRCPLTIEK